MKFPTYYYIMACLLICLSLTACQQKADTTTSEKTTTTASTKKGDNKVKSPEVIEEAGYKYVMTKTGRKVRKAEKGITVVNPDGWKASEMDFHQGYCEQMVGSLEDIDGTQFCKCFLDKIQYYYAPIHFREAYEDQTSWNQECYGEAEK